MCFECSKEPSHRDDSFDYPQHMFWMRNKKTFSYTLLSGGLSLDPYQARHFVGPDLDPNCLTLITFLKEFFKKDMKKISRQQKSRKNFTGGKELTFNVLFPYSVWELNP